MKLSKFLLTGIVIVLLNTCKPPQEWVKNKAKRFKSTADKRKLYDSSITKGTFVNYDPRCNYANTQLIRFNTDQTVQVTTKLSFGEFLYNVNDSNLLEYLDAKVSYYFYYDFKYKQIYLESFEYRDSKWWNFFTSDKFYIEESFTYYTEKQLLENNSAQNSDFCQFYKLDTTMTTNFKKIENEFIDD